MGVRFKAELEKRKKALEDQDLGNFKSLAQKEASEKNAKKGAKVKKITGKIKMKKVVKTFLETNDIQKTAKMVGLSRQQTSAYLQSSDASRTLRQAFEKIGLSIEEVAKINKEEFIDYNKQKVVRSYGEGQNAREVEEMRDGRLAFNALQFAAKYIEADANTIATAGAGEVSSDIAMLAIKNLIQKLDEKQLRIVEESIKFLLGNKMKVV